MASSVPEIKVKSEECKEGSLQEAGAESVDNVTRMAERTIVECMVSNFRNAGNVFST